MLPQSVALWRSKARRAGNDSTRRGLQCLPHSLNGRVEQDGLKERLLRFGSSPDHRKPLTLVR